jgi:hypothetical protein
MKVFWLLPGKNLSNGLRLIWSDTDTMVMSSLVHKFKNFVLYLDHDDNLSGLQWDDIVANPLNSPPMVYSPMNTMRMDNADSGRVPEFCGYDRVDERNDGNLGDATDDDIMIVLVMTEKRTLILLILTMNWPPMMMTFFSM